VKFWVSLKAFFAWLEISSICWRTHSWQSAVASKIGLAIVTFWARVDVALLLD